MSIARKILRGSKIIGTRNFDEIPRDSTNLGFCARDLFGITPLIRSSGRDLKNSNYESNCIAREQNLELEDSNFATFQTLGTLL